MAAASNEQYKAAKGLGLADQVPLPADIFTPVVVTCLVQLTTGPLETHYHTHVKVAKGLRLADQVFGTPSLASSNPEP